MASGFNSRNDVWLSNIVVGLVWLKRVISIAKPVFDHEEFEAVREVLESGWLMNGPKVREFEEKFAGYCGAKFGIAVNSGTSALHIALLALGIGPGDEVITTPFSFIASADCIRLVGAKPVFVDIDLRTYNLDVEKIEDAVSDRTKGIVVVHLYGLCVDMDPVLEVAEKYGLFVVEDAAQAHGGEYKGRKVGSIGHVGCFSFWPTKNMTTGGGGIIVTSDEEVAERARLLRFNGEVRDYRHILLGYNLLMPEIQAAIGLVQLKKLDGFVEKRRRIARFYNEEFADLDLVLPFEPEYAKHVYHLYTVRVDAKKRNYILEDLNKEGVQAKVYYPIPIPFQPSYRGFGFVEGSFPVAEKVAKEVFSLPVHPALSEEDVNFVVEKVKEILRQL